LASLKGRRCDHARQNPQAEIALRHGGPRCWAEGFPVNPPQLVSAAELPSDAVRGLFNGAFADYVGGPFNLSPDEWLVFLGRHGVDLQLSRIAFHGSQARGFALICPRSDRGRWRIGGMALLPASRGDGSARALLADAVQRARAFGCAAIELEVVVQNERAISLYRREGFVATHVLCGYRSQQKHREPPVVGVEIVAATATEAFAWLAETGATVADLPFQVLGQSLRALNVPLQTWRLGTAQLVFSAAPPDAVTIHSLIDRDARQDDARSLIGTLLTRHEGCRVIVNPLQRSDVGGQALLDLGFEVQALRQQHMLKQL
jgi:GNAT superfamily N-acetyltransferase